MEEDLKKGTVQSLLLADVICKGRGSDRCGRNMVKPEVADKYSAHHC